MAFKLYTYEQNPRAYKGLIAAQYAGVTVEMAKKFKIGKTNKEASFLRLNPFGKVPTLETPEGNGVFESNAIARYLAAMNPSTNLEGNTFADRGLVSSFMDTATSIEGQYRPWIYPLFGYGAFNEEARQGAVDVMKRYMSELHAYLQTRTFLVGERVTLADITVCCALFPFMTLVMDSTFRKSFGNVNRWFTTLVNTPQFKAVMGEVTLCEKEKFPEGCGPSAAKKEGKKSPAKKSPSKKGKKSPAKKSPAKKEAAPAKEEKKVNPLLALPKSKFVLDEWKRTYSNKDTRSEAIPWFWENIDLEGYSMWFADYKYNDELEKTFMTSNLIGGFFQRLDRLRKFGFGSSCIFGKEPKLKISSFWLFRGNEIPEEMTTCDDSELYTWRRADPKKDKELINDFLAWDGKFNKTLGSFAEGKVFK